MPSRIPQEAQTGPRRSEGGPACGGRAGIDGWETPGGALTLTLLIVAFRVRQPIAFLAPSAARVCVPAFTAGFRVLSVLQGGGGGGTPLSARPPPLPDAEFLLHVLSEGESGPGVPLMGPLMHLSAVPVQSGRGRDSLRQEKGARRVLGRRAQTVVGEARCRGGHGPDHQTLRVPALLMDATGWAFRIPVFAEQAPDTRSQAVGVIEGAYTDPHVRSSVLQATDEAVGAPDEVPLVPTAGVF